MFIEVLKGKIHRATVTQADLDYVGSVTIDGLLLDAAGIREREKVLISCIETGKRLETYVMRGEDGSGTICLNGAAAHMAQPGDKVIIMCFALMTPEEHDEFEAKIVFVDQDNAITDVVTAEKPGRYGA